MSTPNDHHDSACVVCGAELVYQLADAPMRCVECGGVFPSKAACAAGHFICDACHAKRGIASLLDAAMQTSCKNPWELLQAMMESPFVHMHGNEHHVLVGASLITAYHNAGGELELGAAIREMQSRGSKYPGGSCGFWGACGAAVSAGMYLSIVTGATPLTVDSWGMANRMTSLALARMADIGGPRCCKRNSFIALETAVAYTSEALGVAMELPETIVCTHSRRNKQCIGLRCPYFRPTA